MEQARVSNDKYIVYNCLFSVFSINIYCKMIGIGSCPVTCMLCLVCLSRYTNQSILGTLHTNKTQYAGHRTGFSSYRNEINVNRTRNRLAKRTIINNDY
jgi:hypothetical protein